MPCRPWEKDQQDPAPEHPVTPTKAPCNDLASHDDPDAEGPATQSEEDEELSAKKIRPPRNVLKYVVVPRWVTGERAEKVEDKIQRELDVLMSELMVLSGQRKFFGHKPLPTDNGFWKLRRSHIDIRGNAASHMTCIAVRCAISVSATSVSEL